MIFKYAAHRHLDRLSLLTANYLAAFLISLAVLDLATYDPGVRLSILGIATGVLFIGGFFMLALATEVAGMSLATAVMRISVVIPFVASWIIWDEVPSGFQIAGLVVAGAAFVLISRRRRDEASGPGLSSASTAIAAASPGRVRLSDTAGGATIHSAAAGKAAHEQTAGVLNGPMPFRGRRILGGVFTTLLLLFLMGGIIDTSLKAFDEIFADEHSTTAFMSMVFGVAFLTGLVVVIARRRRTNVRTIAWGLFLGAVNFGSVEFILRAIRQLSGPFVFPANNILLVIGSALLGVLLWNEKLTRANWAGLVLAALALLLLNF